MRSKHDIANKTDYMKAHSFVLIQTERTNSDLEHEKNIGKVDGAFYRNFLWQIMGQKKEAQLSQTDSNDIVQTKRHQAISEVSRTINGGSLYERSHAVEPEEGKVVVQTRTDLKGRSPQRYVSTCYFKPRVVPAWYTESLLIHIGSTKRTYDEKVWFKHKLQPYYWSENMTTEVNLPPTKSHISTMGIAVTEPYEHYISLEPQQLASAGAS